MTSMECSDAFYGSDVIGWWDMVWYVNMIWYVIGTCQSLTVRLYKQLYLTAPAFCFFGVGKVGCVLSAPSSWCEHRWFSLVCCSIGALSIFRCWHLGFVVGYFCLLVVLYRSAYAWMGWYILSSGLLWYWCTSPFQVRADIHYTTPLRGSPSSDFK